MKRRVTMTGLVAVWLMAGCSSISVFDQYAYVQATSLKVESLAVMSGATGAYDSAAVADLMMKIDKATEYEKGRPKNRESARMWSILRDPDKKLLGGFMARWKRDGRLGETFVTEARALVGKAFDILAELESRKINTEEASALFSPLE